MQMQKYKEAPQNLSLSLYFNSPLSLQCLADMPVSTFVFVVGQFLKWLICFAPAEQIKDTVLNDDDIGDSCHEDFLHK